MSSTNVKTLPPDTSNTEIAYVVTEATPLITSVDSPIVYRTTSVSNVFSKTSAHYCLTQSEQRQSDVEQLLGNDPNTEPTEAHSKGSKSQFEVYSIIAVLLLGVFISNADQCLVLATYGTIASEFNDLNSGTWLMSGFILAQCVVQPLYGKLSDIYGRKACLQASYILFVVGTAGSGLGQTMGQVIASRVVQGAGSAGMGSMVSIIITDLVPMREVAAMRSYVNVLHTTGRSCGAVLGGLITQTLSWRWAFFIQIPPTVLAIALVQWRLHLPNKHDVTQSKWEKLRRIDFIGAFFLCLTIFAACFILEVGGQKIPWDSPILITLAVVGVVSTVAFVLSANRVAEPIFPIRLITQYVVITNYLIVILQSIVQMSLMITVAIYFQVTEKASPAAAGAYLIPAFVGNAIAGLLSGLWIKYTGRYKTPTLLAPLSALACVIPCYFLWNGHNSFGASLLTLPGGFSMGLVSSASFVALAAGVGEEDIAIAGSGVYLLMNLGAIAGVSAGSAVFQLSLQQALVDALRELPDRAEILRRALTDIAFVQHASEPLRRLLVPCFVAAFHHVNWISLIISIFTIEHRIVQT